METNTKRKSLPKQEPPHSPVNNSTSSRQALPSLVDAATVAQVTGFHVKTIYFHARQGTIPSFRLGRAVAFDLDEVLKALHRNGNGDNNNGNT